MSESDQMLERYLLGEMAEADKTALEEKYFADTQLFEQLVEAENELTDQYARGQLSPRARQEFERYYLAHPRLRERAKFAQALTAQVDHLNRPIDSTSSTGPWWGRLLVSTRGPKLAWGLSLALLLLVIAAGWLAFQTRRLHQELARSEAERSRQEQTGRALEQQLDDERRRSDQASSELARARSGQLSSSPTPSPANHPALATLILNVTGVRGAETGTPPTLNLPAGVEQARIQLNLRDVDYAGYSVLIHSADGSEIFRHDRLKSTGKPHVSLAFELPANKLAPGDYILTLRGVTQNGEVEDISKSFFRVSQSRKP